eukprot:SAG11_NODE_407_length_9712_cov_11.569437_9_plen_69_part_00
MLPGGLGRLGVLPGQPVPFGPHPAPPHMSCQVSPVLGSFRNMPAYAGSRCMLSLYTEYLWANNRERFG